MEFSGEQNSFKGFRGITADQLALRIEQNGSWALQGNAYIDGAIVKTPIRVSLSGKWIYQTFLRSGERFISLGFKSS